jgi:predicted RNA-binding Zn-ribbon protein involved in translation (DUF1610 family)
VSRETGRRRERDALRCSPLISLSLLSFLPSRAAASTKRKDVDSAPKGRFTLHEGAETVDETLEVYYCAHCGQLSLIMDSLLSDLPLRSTDRSRVLNLKKQASKILMEEGGNVKVKRGERKVERQYRYTCKGCGLFLSYLSHPFTDSANNTYLYLLDGAFSLTNQGKTPAQVEAEEREKMVPIVIPVFKKPADDATAAPTAASSSN